MPNWCSCDLFVRADEPKDYVEINRFKEYAKTKENVLDTEKFIPYPEKFKEIDKKHPNESKSFNLKAEQKELLVDGMNGYDWCCQNWGTKWGICNPTFEADSLGEVFGEIQYYFETAWSPPIPVIVKMSEMFPKLKFTLKYYEGGMGYQGTLVCRGGEILDDSEESYDGNRGG